jgi:solute carrier family 29 (equilibrative nucleoside transporter), member 1/2/3
MKPAEDQEYTPVGEMEDGDDETLTSIREGVPFSWLEYSIFLLLGVAMLWAWLVLVVKEISKY